MKRRQWIDNMVDMELKTEVADARNLDARNGVSRRDRFLIPEHNGEQALYFLGNSLGLQPRNARTHVDKVLQTWATTGVEGFFRGAEPWLQFHNTLAAKLAPVVGAHPAEVVIMNGLTVNLHLLMVSFYQPKGARNKIICEAKAFPSDQYMLETHLRQRGLDPSEIIVEVTPAEGSATITEAHILDCIHQHRESVALVFWGGVNYYSGQLFDMENIARAAHEAGALVGFDLAHAAGNVVLRLHQWDVDFAAWCNYKYLNAGPGAVAAAFVHERYHQDATLQRMAGWWGYQKDTRFKMQKGFVPVQSAEGWGLSTPSPLLFAALAASLEIFEYVSMEELAAKGQEMSSYLISLIEGINTSAGRTIIQVLTPLGVESRGCQVSMLFQQGGLPVFEYLSQVGIYADWREPDVIRVAPAPLYNTFEEIWLLVQALEQACKKFLL